MSDESDFRLPNGRFARGNPGGPGRPRVDQVSELDRQVAEAGPELVEVLLTAAKAGNLRAVELVLDRVWPARRGRPVRVDAPEIHSTADLKPASEALTSAVLSGELTPQEGSDAARVLVAHGDMIGLVDLDERLTVLEEKHAKAQKR
jgi:hypothetical protein